jgi:mono/diheme cytochrome c family protein
MRSKVATAVIIAIAIGVMVDRGGAAARLADGSASARQPSSVWDGVYSAAQQKRGEAIYARECSTCHGETLKGGEGAPPLRGADFLAGWDSRAVADLFDKIRETMPAPPEQPGKLSPQQNADVVSFILSVNAFPSGDRDLPPDTEPLKQIRITAKR